MKEKYEGKVKVPFCVKNETGETYPEIFCEILDFTPHLRQCSPDYYHYCYFGVDKDGIFDYWWDVEDFGENTTVYNLEELKAIVDEVNNDTATLTEDEYVDVGEDETVSNERLKLIGKYVKTPLYPTEWAIVEKYIKDQDIYEVVYSFQDGDGVFVPADCLLEVVDTIPQTTALSIKANISFDVNIKGQTFSLTEKELQDLYVQLCLAEGTLQDWRLGQ